MHGFAEGLPQGASNLTVQVGDRSLPDALSRTIADELPFLRRVARRWYSSGTEAEDLAQDTIVSAIASADQWQPGSNLRGWLFTIMRNRFLAMRARSKRTEQALQAYADANPPPEFDSSNARLTLRDIERALGRLPQAQSMALILVSLEEKSYEATAQAMGLSVDAVRCHLSRARKSLRTAVFNSEQRSPLKQDRLGK